MMLSSRTSVLTALFLGCVLLLSACQSMNSMLQRDTWYAPDPKNVAPQQKPEAKQTMIEIPQDNGGNASWYDKAVRSFPNEDETLAPQKPAPQKLPASFKTTRKGSSFPTKSKTPDMTVDKGGFPNLSSVPLQPPVDLPQKDEIAAKKSELQADRNQAQNLMARPWDSPPPAAPADLLPGEIPTAAPARNDLTDDRPWMKQSMNAPQPLVPPRDGPPPAAMPWQQPMPSIGSAAPALVPPIDGGMNPAVRDPIAPTMQQYQQRMQQSAPYTSGTQYNPYSAAPQNNNWYYYNQSWNTYGSPDAQKIVSPNTLVIPPKGVTPKSSASVSSDKPVATIYFKDNSAVLGAKEKKVLAKLSGWMRDQGGSLHIVGHASARTRDMQTVKQKMRNYKLSLDRAEAIGKELRRLGVDSESIRTEALGDNDPVYAETMPNGESWNRRADVYWEPI